MVCFRLAASQRVLFALQVMWSLLELHFCDSTSADVYACRTIFLHHHLARRIAVFIASRHS
jgi:hypothetical protein